MRIRDVRPLVERLRSRTASSECACASRRRRPAPIRRRGGGWDASWRAAKAPSGGASRQSGRAVRGQAAGVEGEGDRW